MRKLAIIGASGHGKVVADIAKKNGYEEIVFFDDNEKIQECSGYPVLGKSSEAGNMDADIIVAIGNANIRERIQEMFVGKNIVTLIHPEAIVAEDVVCGAGTVVMAGSVINTGAKIGCGCIINTCSSVDHDCVIDDYVHVSVGAHVAGTCVIGKKTWIGVGAIVSNNINICGDCLIGAGAVVIKNIEKPGKYVGVPIKEIK